MFNLFFKKKFARERLNHNENLFFGGGGFTLVELLVVISIIGFLSSVVFAGLQTARIRARDAKRVSDINQIEKALILYADAHGVFPLEVCADRSTGSDDCGCPACGIAGSCTATNWCTTSGIKTGLVDADRFLPSLPIDPINDSSRYYYYEPCCGQDCGNGRSCGAGKCCEYTIGASILERTGAGYSRSGRYD